MPRPKRLDGHRDKEERVYLSPEESQLLEQAAAFSNISKSEYMRRIVVPQAALDVKAAGGTISPAIQFAAEKMERRDVQSPSSPAWLQDAQKAIAALAASLERAAKGDTK